MGNPFRNGSPSVMEPPSREQAAAATQGSMESSSTSNPSNGSSVLTRMLHRPLVVAMILGVVSLSFLLAGIGRPAFMYYDEGVYVPEARPLSKGSSTPALRCTTWRDPLS